MILIKLGGSVITAKRSKYSFEKSTTLRLVSEIAETDKSVIIVHGAGSFGHILAKEYELHKGYSDPDQIHAVAEVQRDVRHLNFMVLNAFLENGFNAVSLAPSTYLINENKAIKTINLDAFRRYLDLDITPITFGDVVLDDALKFSICSGDLLMLELAKAFNPEKVLFVADVDGIFSSDPASDDDAHLLEVVNEDSFSKIKKTRTEVDDVTGSIFGKVEIMFKIAALGYETLILNGTVDDRLKDAVMGNDITCTRIISKAQGGIK
jgi:isopentenyl phosphate kinase